MSQDLSLDELIEHRRCEIASMYQKGKSDKSLEAIYTLRDGVISWSVMTSNGAVEENFATAEEAVKRYNELP